MVTEAAVMAVVRVARPVYRGAHDGIAFAANAAFLGEGYSLYAVGVAALAGPLPSGEEKVEFYGWNGMDNRYAFFYSKEEEDKKKCILMDCLVNDDYLDIAVVDVATQHKLCNVKINVKDFFSEEQHNNYKDMYKNFTGFINILNSSLLVKLDGKDADDAQNLDAEISSPRNSSENDPWENPSTMTVPACSEYFQWTTEHFRLTYPPVAPFGYDDTFPAPGSGFYPHSGGRGGGSMHVGPNDPLFFPSDPSPTPGDPGSVPPGGRHDPIGPPDVPGFEPSRFVRQHPDGCAHPDLEFFQHGPDF